MPDQKSCSKSSLSARTRFKVLALLKMVAQLAMDLTSPMMFPYARFDIAGVENIPTDGPAIIVGNHRSYFDSAAMVVTIAKSKRTARFLGKKEVFDVPIVGPLIERLGGRVKKWITLNEPYCTAIIGNLIAGSIGPTVPALLTDYVFRDPAKLGLAIVWVEAAVMPLSLLLLWRGFKPYRASVERAGVSLT